MDSWLYYEVCEESLGSCLYELKNEVINGEKAYRVNLKIIYRFFIKNWCIGCERIWAS
jgi:hypothetical protein